MPCVALSRKYIFILESPMYFNMKAMLGISTYDSDDDTYERDGRDYWLLRWNPQV